MAWYTGEKKLTKSASDYCFLLEELFMVQDPRGLPVPYKMTAYQREWHSESINILDEDALDILVVKARGISFTTSFSIDFIITALSFKDQILPIVSQRFRGAQDILKTMAWLIRNCNIPDIMSQVEIKETEIYFKKTNSIIRAYPSGKAADAIRGRRLIRALIDEYAFQSNDKELLVAVQDTMQGQLGQIVIGSTPNGRHNHFKTLCNNPVGFAYYALPVFNPHTFNVNQSILEQDLDPIAPWIDLRKLEEKRGRDINSFEQEYMCSFLDDSISFYPLSLVKRCENPHLVNLAEEIETNSSYVYHTQNPIRIGVDVARTSHFTAISVFEEMEHRHVQRALFAMRGKDIPTQVKFIVSLARIFPTCIRITIDQTGLGLGLFEYVRKALPSIARGVTFSAKMKTGEYRQNVKIREYMLVNLKNFMEGDQLELLVDELQEHHMTQMTYDFQIKADALGHGDIIFANALALLPQNYRVMGMPGLASERKPSLLGPNHAGAPTLAVQRLSHVVPSVQEMPVEQKIAWLRKQKR